MKDEFDDFKHDDKRCDLNVPKPFGFGAYQCGNYKMKGRRVCWIHRNKENTLKPRPLARDINGEEKK